MLIKFDFNNMMTDFIGDQGISTQDIEAVRGVAEAAFDYFEDNRGTGMTGWAELPYNQDEIVNDIIATAASPFIFVFCPVLSRRIAQTTVMHRTRGILFVSFKTAAIDIAPNAT